MSQLHSEAMKMIVFYLDGKEYGLPISQIRSIEKKQAITRVPGTTGYIKGVINLRGVVMPVIDLRMRFGLKQTNMDDNTRIIIATLGEIEVGIIVDEARDVLDVKQEMIERESEVAGSVQVDYILGVAKIENRLIIMLDLKEILEHGQGGHVLQTN